jgi:hypothetical protein
MADHLLIYLAQKLTALPRLDLLCVRRLLPGQLLSLPLEQM